MSNFKPKRGSSFFLKRNSSNQNQEVLYAFGIVLSSRSDEDDEYKVVRTDFSKSPRQSLLLPLEHTDNFDFENTELYEVVEWNKDIVKSLSRKNLFGSSYEVRYVERKENTSFVEERTEALNDPLEGII